MSGFEDCLSDLSAAGIVTMSADDYRLLERRAELEDMDARCGGCSYACLHVGAMDDDGFRIEPWDEHVFCTLRKAVILDAHRACADWS